MKNASGWTGLFANQLVFSRRWACVAAAIGFAAALAPASAAQAPAKGRRVKQAPAAGRIVINSFNGTGLTLRAYINGILKQNKLADGVADAPHMNFWDSLDYKEFTTGNVPGVDSGPNPPYRILVVGNATNSNLVMALQGTGPLFDKDNGAIGRMPANAEPPEKPFFTEAQIQPIIDWINRGCPNPGGK